MNRRFVSLQHAGTISYIYDLKDTTMDIDLVYYAFCLICLIEGRNDEEAVSIIKWVLGHFNGECHYYTGKYINYNKIYYFINTAELKTDFSRQELINKFQNLK